MGSNGKTVLVIDDSPTVRRLAEIVLTQASYTVYTAEDGDVGIDMTRKVRPSVILVDFVMPKMNGYKFCKILRSDAELRDIPIILITSKGEEVGQKFEQQFGVLHYFSKPFEPEDLTRKLEEVLAEAESAPPAEGAPAAEQPPAQPLTGDVVDTFQERFDRVVRQYFQKDFPLLMKRVLSDTLRETGLVKDDTLILSGKIKMVSLPDILQFAHMSRLSGRLSVISRTMFGEVFLDNGLFVFATVSKKDSHNFLSDLLLADGKLDAKTLRKIIEESREKSMPIGKILVSRGIISSKELGDYLLKQAQSAFNSILEITEGNFYLENAPLPINLQDVNTRMPLPKILVEGLRVLDEKQIAAAQFKDESVVFMRLITSEDALASVDLSEKEMKIFSMVNGRLTLRELVDQSRLDSLEVKRICYSLQKIGLLRIKDNMGRS